jgi:hypothetical protein
MNYVFNDMLGRDTRLDANRMAEFRGWDVVMKQNAARLEQQARAGNPDPARQAYARLVDQLRDQFGRLQAIAPDLELFDSQPPEAVAVRALPRDTFRDITAALLETLELVDRRPAPADPLGRLRAQGQASQVLPGATQTGGALSMSQLGGRI